MISFVLGIGGLCSLLYLALLFKSSSLALLGFTEAVLMLLSFCWLIKDLRGLKVQIQMPIQIAEKNREFHMQLLIGCSKKLGYQKIKVLVAYRNTFGGKEQKTYLTASPVAYGNGTYEYQLEITAPGNYEFQILKVRVYDLAGLFFLNKKIVSSANAMVLPDIREIPVAVGERVNNFFGDADVFDELRPGYDPAEVFSVREFRDGDKLPSVHWKLSAKMDTLMVKENSLPKACPVVLMLNGGKSKVGEMIELAASLSFSMMDAGCPHFCVWLSKSTKDLIRTRVDDEESFYQFLTTFLQDGSREVAEDLQAQYTQKYRGEQYLHELLLENGKLYLDREEIADPKTMELILR